jgi:hypothetical protein
MAQKLKAPIRQNQVLAKDDSNARFLPIDPAELPSVHIEWTATEQARIAEILASEPAEPTPELMRALRAPSGKK